IKRGPSRQFSVRTVPGCVHTLSRGEIIQFYIRGKPKHVGSDRIQPHPFDEPGSPLLLFSMVPVVGEQPPREVDRLLPREVLCHDVPYPRPAGAVPPENDCPALPAPEYPDVPDITLAAAAGAPGDAYLHFCREVHFLVHPLYLEAESERVLHPVFTGLGARACLDIVDTGGSRLPDRHPKVLPDRRDLLFFHPDEHHSLARGHLDHWDLEFPGNIRD